MNSAGGYYPKHIIHQKNDKIWLWF